MFNYFTQLKDKLHIELSKSARDYLKTGLLLFHQEQNNYYSSIQPSIGNLCISIELILKSFLIKINPLLVYNNLPIELKVFFSSSESIPNNFRYRKYDIDLRSFAYNTIELNDCISMFYIFYPQHKQTFKPYFQFLSKCRNLSVHAAIPSFQRYDLDRIAYFSIKLFELLNEYARYKFSKKDLDFVNSFAEERAERVKTKVEKSKENSKNIEHSKVLVNNSWKLFIIKCPVCGSDALLYGYTDETVHADEDGITMDLEFFAEKFECSLCGLKLDDPDELKLVDLDVVYNRNDEMADWIGQFHVYVDDYEPNYEPDYEDYEPDNEPDYEPDYEDNEP